MAKRGKSRRQAKGKASAAKRSSPKRSAPAKAAPRAGSVAAKRAAGTNKAAQNKAAQNKAGGNNPVRARDRTQEQKQARRQDRQDSYNAQNVTQASDFDFADRTKNKVGAGEVRHLRKQGYDRESIQQAAADSGLRVGGKAQQRFDRWDARAAAREKAQEVVQNPVKQPVEENSNANVEQEPNTTPVHKPTFPMPTAEPIINKPITVKPTQDVSIIPTTNTEVEQTQDQEVTQDNDINSTVTGDNNNVNISQDNSVRQYGGVNKSFVYNGSTNGKNYMDTPVSAATMGGFYHDEDSPAKSASFVDRYQTMNRDYQKQFSNNNFAQQAITGAAQTAAIDVGALDQRVNDRAKLSRARSTSMAGDIFGDMFNFSPQEFASVKYDD